MTTLGGFCPGGGTIGLYNDVAVAYYYFSNNLLKNLGAYRNIAYYNGATGAHGVLFPSGAINLQFFYSTSYDNFGGGGPPGGGGK